MPRKSIFPILMAASAVLAACHGDDPFDTGAPPTPMPQLAVGAPDFEEFEVCKYGSAATFDYSVYNRTTTVTTTGQFTLQDGGCYVVAMVGGAGADVTVTEQVPAGFFLDHVDVTVLTTGPTLTTRTESGPSVTDFIAGGGTATIRGVLAEFYNEPEMGNGRMTGGGRQIDVGNVSITRGFTVHCDITLSNNIEINWAGNSWHLDKPIDTARCFDDPAISQDPPKAPFDTFVGTATGRLNGVDGSALQFIFVDAGEPGKNDMAALKIWDASGAVVLDLPLSHLDNGNIQAHEDQPHK